MKVEINRILVPTDFSETSNYAVEKAARMASKFDAELFIIHVLEGSAYKLVKSDENPKEKVVVQKNIMDRLENLSKNLSATYHISVNTLLGEERVVEVIEDAVRDNNIDMVIMGTHGASGIREFLLGSNAQKVVNNCVCPVITFKMSPGEHGFETIVLPVESWNSSLEKLDYVSCIAKKYNSRVHILGIMASDKKNEMRKVLTLVDATESYLNEANIPCVRKIITSQMVAKETLQYAEEINANLIMVMTERESSLRNVIPFIFAKHIINHSGIPVMSVKPLMYRAEKIKIQKRPTHFRKEHSNINK